MKRPVAIFIILAFLAMLGRDSNACYLLMLTCDGSMTTCVVPEVSEIPSCEFSCGGCGSDKTYEPTASAEVATCSIPFTTETGYQQHCRCEMVPPPIFSIAAERKLLESHSTNKPPIAFALVPIRSGDRIDGRDIPLSSVHITIPTTVMRC